MKPLKECKILVTPTSFGKGDPSMITELQELAGEVVVNTTGRRLLSEELAQMLKGVDGFIAGNDIIDKNALRNADNLRVIARYGVGLDNIDLEEARARGIVVTNTPGANTASVAEQTITLILALMRKLPEAVAATRSGGWPRLHGHTLVNKTVGMLGFGAIGKQVARRLSNFDCHLLAYDPYPDHETARSFGVTLVSRDEVLAGSDIITLHLPLLPETRQMINAETLARMKQGSYLINTSRGELVDEDALLQAVQSGHIAGAGLDVFCKEPPDPDSPFLHMPQFVVTPHGSSHTDGAMNAMGRMSMDECLRVLRGDVPKYPVK